MFWKKKFDELFNLQVDSLAREKHINCAINTHLDMQQSDPSMHCICSRPVTPNTLHNVHIAYKCYYI